MTPGGSYRPFANGAQYRRWQGANCEHCAKFWGHAPDAGWGRCAIADALSIAYIADGTVPAEIARRMGYVGPGPYGWTCPERQTAAAADDGSPRRAGGEG